MAIPGKVGGIQLEEEYKKKTLISPSDIEKLREWMLTQPHLPAEHITDLDLILAYHCCDRSTGVTKTVLDLHFTIKTLFTNIFKDRAVDEKVIYTCKTKCFLPLEVHARDDSAVIYCSLIDPDYKTFVFSEAVKSVLMVLDLWQYQAGTWPGFVILIDLSQLSLGHLGKLDLQTIQQFLYYLQETVLLKLKGLHFLNAPSFMDKLMMLLKPFLKKELLDVLHIHQVGSKTLDRFVPMEGLPKEAGGDFKTYKQASDDVIEWMKANEDFFVKENKKRVIESKRLGKPKTISDIFGSVEGSFKKLDID